MIRPFRSVIMLRPASGPFRSRTVPVDACRAHYLARRGRRWPTGPALTHDAPEMLDTTRSEAATSPEGDEHEPRGCLFALSQPPLMIFLAVIGSLFLMAALHDLLLL